MLFRPQYVNSIHLFIWISGATNDTEELLLHHLHADALPCYHTALSSLLRNFRKRSMSIASRIYLKTGECHIPQKKNIVKQVKWRALRENLILLKSRSALETGIWDCASVQVFSIHLKANGGKNDGGQLARAVQVSFTPLASGSAIANGARGNDLHVL